MVIRNTSAAGIKSQNNEETSKGEFLKLIWTEEGRGNGGMEEIA